MTIQTIEEGRKKDGNRLIADKILKQLHELEKTFESNYGRWAWELLQNARDSVSEDDSRVVDVSITLGKNELVFEHNGGIFDEYDLRGLLNQISSKEAEEGKQTRNVGRFGTGFITTHLLSRKVQVQSVVRDADGQLYNFSVLLNREGKTVTELVPKIEQAWLDFHESASPIVRRHGVEYKTRFTYHLSEKGALIAKYGLEEFKNLAPVVLAFIPKIGKVEIDAGNHTVIYQRRTSTCEIAKRLDGLAVSVFETKLSRFQSTRPGSPKELLFAVLQDEEVGVAAIIDTQSEALIALDDTPKLFCEFPLIGTEDFCFPVLVNSFNFSPKSDRDGIWLKGDDDEEVLTNRSLLQDATSLYQQLLLKLSEAGVRRLYHAANTLTPTTDRKFFDATWYEAEVQPLLREIVLTTPIVDLHTGERVLFKGPPVNEYYCDFPSHYKDDQRHRIWELASKTTSCLLLPERESIDFWDKIIWDDFYRLTARSLSITLVSTCENMEELGKYITNKTPSEWLNQLYALIIDEGEQAVFNEYAIVPNQHGVLCKVREKLERRRLNGPTHKSILYRDDIQDEELIHITLLLGWDYQAILISNEITHTITEESIKKDELAKVTTKGFKSLREKELDENAIEATLLMTEWFGKYPELGAELFPELYSQRAELFIRVIEDKDSLFELMRSDTPMAELAELSKALKNNPELRKVLEKWQRDKAEEAQRNRMGEQLEQLLKRALENAGLQVSKTHVGKDLIIQLQGMETIDIEIKSSRGNFVAMTPTQADTALQRGVNYVLCVLRPSNSIIELKQSARFIFNIGAHITHSLETIDSINSLLSESLTDVTLMLNQEMDYRVKVKAGLWRRHGIRFGEFVEEVKRRL